MLRCPLCDDPIDMTSQIPIVEVTLKKQHKCGYTEIEKMEFVQCPSCNVEWIEMGCGTSTIDRVKKFCLTLSKARKKRHIRVVSERIKSGKLGANYYRKHKRRVI